MMRFIHLYHIFTTAMFLVLNAAFAQSNFKNNAKVKVEPGTYFIAKGDVQVNDNATFRIQGMATIKGELHASGNGYIKVSADANHCGSLIFNGGTPEAAIQQYYPTGRNYVVGAMTAGVKTDDYKDQASPVRELSFYWQQQNFFKPTSEHNEFVDQGEGYLYKIGPGVLEGVMQNQYGQIKGDDAYWDASTIPPLNYSPANNNFYALANPYTSAVDLDGGVVRNGLEESYWKYDPEQKRVFFYNSTGYGNLLRHTIYRGEGFFVRSIQPGATFRINAAARVHKRTGMVSALPPNGMIVLEVTDPTSLKDEVWVGYNRVNDFYTSDNFTNGVDITKLKTFKDLPQIYASHNGLELSVDMITKPTNRIKEVPVSFIAVADGNHQISVKNLTGFTDVHPTLVDLVTYRVIDLETTNTYTFNASAGDNEHRFVLRFTPDIITQTQQGTGKNMARVFAAKDHIVASSNNELALQAKTMYIYNTSGTLLDCIPLEANTTSRVQNTYNQPILIVKVVYSQHSIVEKITFRNN